jgi:osmotically-inducible protein OsmY
METRDVRDSIIHQSLFIERMCPMKPKTGGPVKATIFCIFCGSALAGCQSSGQTGMDSSGQPYGNQTNTSQTYSSNNRPADDNASGTGATVTRTDSTNNGVNSNVPAANPDNTAINARDRNSYVPTADSQGQTKSDIDVTASIRRGIMDRKLSVDAQNVKIITQNGHVTLRGPVNSLDEKQTIGQLASDAAGAANVDNQLELNNSASVSNP